MKEKDSGVLISEAIAGLDYKIVILNGSAYKVYPPTIRTIAKAFSYWLKDKPKDKTFFEYMERVEEVSENRLNGLAAFLKVDPADIDCTVSEYNEAQDICLSLMSADDFFQPAISMESVETMIAKPK